MTPYLRGERVNTTTFHFKFRICHFFRIAYVIIRSGHNTSYPKNEIAVPYPDIILPYPLILVILMVSHDVNNGISDTHLLLSPFKTSSGLLIMIMLIYFHILIV